MPFVTYIWFAGGGNAPVTLGDDAIGDCVSGAQPEFEPKTELVTFAGAQFALNVEHGNAVQRKTWRVDYNKLTLDAAVIFRATHAQSLPVVLGVAGGVLQELLDDGTTRFYQNCTRPKVKCVSWDGQSVVFEYSVQFGQVTTVQNP